MKKIAKGKVFLTTVLFTFLLSTTAFAYTQKDGKITADSVKIRSTADAASTVVGSTEKGKTVTIVGETTDSAGTTWYEVYVDTNVTGYIRGDLLQTTASANTDTETSTTTTQTGTAQSSVKAISGTGVVTPDSINIRNGAVNGEVLCTLASGSVVTITGEITGSDSKKWYEVTFIKNSQTYTGFIRADLLDTSAEATAKASAENGAETEQPAETEETEAAQTTAEGSADATLQTLTISDGTLTPEFSSEVTDYTINVEEGITEITVSAIVNDEKAQIISADGFKELQAGINAATIVVQAENGTSVTYNFSIVSGEVSSVGTDTVQEEVLDEELEEDTSDMVDVSEYEKYRALAGRRLIIICILAFLLALCGVIIINLLLKIHDMKDDLGGDDEDEDEEPEEEPKTKVKGKRKGSVFAKPEYVKLDGDREEKEPLSESLTQKEQARRAEQKAKRSVFMPDLREEKNASEDMSQEQKLEEAEENYEDTGLDDDFEFEFINLDVKR